MTVFSELLNDKHHYLFVFLQNRMSNDQAEFKWLDVELMKTVVAKQLHETGLLAQENIDIEIKSVKPAISAGENFLGVVLRVTVEASVNNTKRLLNYVVKAQAGDKLDEIAVALNAYPTEIEMYTKILPALQEMLNKAGIEISLAPKCYHVQQKGEHTVIVLEDLRDTGFANEDRIKGLDLQHALKTIERMAALHAASMTYHERVK